MRRMMKLLKELLEKSLVALVCYILTFFFIIIITEPWGRAERAARRKRTGPC